MRVFKSVLFLSVFIIAESFGPSLQARGKCGIALADVGSPKALKKISKRVAAEVEGALSSAAKVLRKADKSKRAEIAWSEIKGRIRDRIPLNPRQRMRVRGLYKRINKAIAKNSEEMLDRPELDAALLIANNFGLKSKGSIAIIQSAANGMIISDVAGYGVYRTPKKALTVMVLLGAAGTWGHSELSDRYPDEMKTFDAGIVQLYEATPADELYVQLEEKFPEVMEWSRDQADTILEQASLLPGGFDDELRSFDKNDKDKWDWD